MELEKVDVLIPVDFSETSENGIRTATKLALRVQGTYHLVHIVSQPVPANVMQGPDTVSRQQPVFQDKLILDSLLDKRKSDLMDLKRKYDFGGSEIRIEVILGDFNTEIANYVDEHHIDMVVMGTEGENSLTQIFSGSHAERVIRHTDIPVLAIREFEPDLKFDKLLLALDIRDYHESAVRRIKNFADKLSMETLLVHVVRKKDAAFENIESRLSSFAEKHGFKRYKIIADAGNKVAEKLEALSGEYEADIIATLSEAESGLIRLFFGSRTKDLLKQTDIPLLSVHDR